MRKILLSLCLLLSLSFLSANATVKDFYGKVKVKYSGDTRWSKLQIGQELPANAIVSTGFNSQVVLDLGNATLDVLPLTRMTVMEITESSNTIKTSLFLQGGKIKADVAKIEGKQNDFEIRSPVATASVRGTSFEFTGNTLTVYRGVVAFGPPEADEPSAPTEEAAEEEESAEGEAESDVPAEPSKGVTVKAGGQTQMSSPGARPVPPSVMAKKITTVSASTKPAVIKKVIKETMSGDVAKPEVPAPSVVQDAVNNVTRIKIKIELKED